MDELIERLRNFEGSDELGNGDFSLLHEAADALEALRAERDALRAERDELAEQLRLATIAEALAEAEANDAALAAQQQGGAS